MNTIEGLTIRWQPCTVSAILAHLWQSTLVGIAILLLMHAARRASARTRWLIAWIALAKFILPLVWFNPTISHLKPRLVERAGFCGSFLPAWGQVIVNRISSSIGAAKPDALTTIADPVPIFAAIVWSSGATVLIASWFVRGFLFRRRVLATAAPISGTLRARVDWAAERAGLARSPRCVGTKETTGPGILGIFSPVVVLPDSLETTLSGDEVDAVVMHELIHLRRRDSWLTALQAIVVRIFWFDPVVWLINRSLQVEMEKSCDEAVLNITADAQTYVFGLLKVVRQSLGIQEPAFSGATGVPIVGRIKNILGRAAVPHLPRPMLAAVCSAIGLVAFSGFSGAIRTEGPLNMPAGKVLVVRDIAPWSRVPDFETKLGDLGFNSATIRSADMATTDFSQFNLIVIPQARRQTGFNADYAKAADRFDRFVKGGGTLLLELNGTEAEGFLRQSFRAIPSPSDAGASGAP